MVGVIDIVSINILLARKSILYYTKALVSSLREIWHLCVCKMWCWCITSFLKTEKKGLSDMDVIWTKGKVCAARPQKNVKGANNVP